MKKLLSALLAVFLLASLSACRKTAPEVVESAPASAGDSAVSAPEATALPTIRPTETAEGASCMSDTFFQDDSGVLWTSLADGEGITSLADILPQDIGYVYGFLISGETIYAVIKESPLYMDGASLYAFDIETGEGTLLAENCSAGCGFCLVGNRIFYETDSDGLWALEISTGETLPALPDAVELFAAHDGYFYYSKADGALYRNDSTFAAETQILEAYDSFWFCPEPDALCDLAYAESGTIAVLEFRDFDGTLRAQRTLDEAPTGLYARDGVVYVPQAGSGTLLIFDIAAGELARSVPLEADNGYCLVRAVTDDAIYYEVSGDGTFYLCRMDTDGANIQRLFTFSIN